MSIITTPPLLSEGEMRMFLFLAKLVSAVMYLLGIVVSLGEDRIEAASIPWM